MPSQGAGPAPFRFSGVSATKFRFERVPKDRPAHRTRAFAGKHEPAMSLARQQNGSGWRENIVFLCPERKYTCKRKWPFFFWLRLPCSLIRRIRERRLTKRI